MANAPEVMAENLAMWRDKLTSREEERGNDASKALNGTSMAAPQVSGVLALLRSKGLSRDDARNRVFQNAVDRGDNGQDKVWGFGFLDAECSVTPGAQGC